MPVEIVCDDGNRCGEGPIWDPFRNRLLWADAEGSLAYAYYPEARRREVLSSRLPVSSIALNHDGSLVLAGASGVYLRRRNGDCSVLADRHQGEDLVFNDCLAGPAGGLYLGTYYWSGDRMLKTGKLYLLDTEGALRVLDEGFQIANGLGISPDEATLYFADSGAREIYAYDLLPSGALLRRRPFVRVRDEDGLPDGLTVDGEGHVWSALWYAGQVVRYDPEGKEERRIHLPAKQVSSLAFGGPGLTDLYVTSASEYWPSPYLPAGFDPRAHMGGALYRLRPGIAGKAEHHTGFRSP